MKGLDKNIEQDKVVISAQKQVEKKRVLIGSVRPHPNQRCFEINTLTDAICEATYTANAHFTGGVKKSIDIKENCFYVVALNKANALKKYKKANIRKTN